MEWNSLSIPKLQRCNRWSLGMDKLFLPMLYKGCNYLSMMGLKLNHVSKWGPSYICHQQHLCPAAFLIQYTPSICHLFLCPLSPGAGALCFQFICPSVRPPVRLSNPPTITQVTDRPSVHPVSYPGLLLEQMEGMLMHPDNMQIWKDFG